MKLLSLHDLYVDELKDLYSAENQLLKALPKMAKAATSDELRTAFEEHLERPDSEGQRREPAPRAAQSQDRLAGVLFVFDRLDDRVDPSGEVLAP